MLLDVRRYIRRRLYNVSSKPSRVQIEVTNRCNLDCPMCQRRYYGLAYEDMPLPRYQTIVDRLPDNIWIVNLTGWGEPILHPQFFDLVRYARDRKLKASFTTNGIGWDETALRKTLDSGVDFVNFSIDCSEVCEDDVAHPYHQKAWDTLGKLIVKRGRKSGPDIGVAITIREGKTTEIKRVVKRAIEMGIKRLTLSRLDIRFNPGLKRPSLMEEKHLCEDIQAIAKENNVSISSPHSRSRDLLRQYLGWERLCPQLYDYVYINLCGDVTPCCSLPRQATGNLLKSPLNEIWRGEAFQLFRQKWRAVCGRCDVLLNHYLTD